MLSFASAILIDIEKGKETCISLEMRQDEVAAGSYRIEPKTDSFVEFSVMPLANLVPGLCRRCAETADSVEKQRRHVFVSLDGR